MQPIGPGAVPELQTDVPALLDGASEYEYVTILNPFSVDFIVRVAQDVPVNMPMDIRAKTGLTQNSNDVARTYGLDLKNPDFKGRKHIMNDTIIKAGKTINLKGNEAQVAVRQIVNELMQREGNAKLLPDPNLRRQAEERVIVRRGSIQELMDGNLKSQREQLDAAINQSNEAVHESGVEQADNSQAAGTGNTDSQPEGQARRVGRPKKTDSQ